MQRFRASSQSPPVTAPVTKDLDRRSDSNFQRASFKCWHHCCVRCRPRSFRVRPAGTPHDLNHAAHVHNPRQSTPLANCVVYGPPSFCLPQKVGVEKTREKADEIDWKRIRRLIQKWLQCWIRIDPGRSAMSPLLNQSSEEKKVKGSRRSQHGSK